MFDKMRAYQSGNKDKINQIKLDNAESKLEIFERNLADARRLNMPYNDAEALIDIANSIVPPIIYETFMTKNMHNKERIENYKAAISRRVESHFDYSKKERMIAL